MNCWQAVLEEKDYFGLWLQLNVHITLDGLLEDKVVRIPQKWPPKSHYCKHLLLSFQPKWIIWIMHFSQWISFPKLFELANEIWFQCSYCLFNCESRVPIHFCETFIFDYFSATINYSAIRAAACVWMFSKG